ncbi:MAG TPA: pyridoxal phosphate-dependent aminotransferase [Stellaceae bacterium]|nr:pyridoxal phosphate-dependent aminotransferase [Stellaceae bacterium]
MPPLSALQFAPLTGRIAGRGARAWSIHFEALRRRAAGSPVILLTVGDPDQEAPAAVVEATTAALQQGRTGYSPILGLPELRAAIAARVERRSGVSCTAENIAVVPGTQAGLYAALQCLAGPGDEVLAFEPIYATYEAVVGAASARLVTAPLRPETGFHPDLAALAAAVTPQTRVLWINTPHNPTGAVFTAAEIEAVAELARRHDLWLLSDEVYEDLAFARPHLSPRRLPGMAERTVVVSSLSKSHAMPGFRLGWIVGPEALTPHLFNLMLCMLYGGPPFIQLGALAALQHDLPEAAALAAEYQRRAALFAGILAEAPGCRAIPPEGGMFLLLDVRGTGLSAEDFARALLAEEGVAAVPCDGFGPSGHLRLALTQPADILAEAGQRIVRQARRLAARGAR